MRTKIEYPVNGTDLTIFIYGSVIGSREMHDIELWEVIAKLNNTEVFRYDGDYHGLLAETDLGEEIMNIANNFLVEEKFYEQV